MAAMIHRGPILALLALALPLALAPGCGSSADKRPTACAPGQTVACACPSGAASLQICTNAGSYAACACEDAGGDAVDAGGGTDGAAGAGASGGGGGRGGAVAIDGGSDGPEGAGGGGRGVTSSGGRAGADAGMTADGALPATGCVPSRKLIGGPEILIDLFPTDDGIIVVRADAVLLIGRDGVTKKTVAAERTIKTASFDGTTLVVGDAALITIYSLALESSGTVLLTEACVSSVLMDGGIFVCGPANDWDRIFYTYDVNAKTAVARSTQTFTYHGRPMRRVPGTSYFVTVTTDLSPSDFYLYKVLPGGTDVVYVNESPYHGDFAATTTYGFAGTPVTHLVNLDGLLLRIIGDGCDSAHNSFTSGCFVKDGAVGTLPSGRYFLALANDAAGRLFAVTNTGSNTSSFDPLCPGGCAVQQIDVAARTVVNQRSHLMASRRFVALRPDSACKMVAVGYEVATSTSSSTYSGYQVDLVDYGEM